MPNRATAGTDTHRGSEPVGDEVRAEVVTESRLVAKAPGQAGYLFAGFETEDRQAHGPQRRSGRNTGQTGSNHRYRRKHGQM